MSDSTKNPHARTSEGNGRHYGDSTIASSAGICDDANYGAIMPPLYLSSTYRFEDFGQAGDYTYSRSGNPTRDCFARALADIEGGFGATITATGLAALDVLLHQLGPDDTLFVPQDCYGGTYRQVTALAGLGHFHLRFVDPCDLEAFERAVSSEKPRMIILESPSNPTLRITDITHACEIGHAHDAIMVVDNTFLSPVFQKPLMLGADIVWHSTTKLINGHSDMVGGALIAVDRDMHERLQWWCNCLGASGSPFDSYLALRGLRSLDVRARRQAANAQAIAEYLEGHDKVARVIYPGLQSHGQHGLANSQHEAHGIIVTFALQNGDNKRVAAFIRKLELFNLAESLGGVESLICHPPTMTHAPLDEAALSKAGIEHGMLRLSIGLEDVDDLIADLDGALDAPNPD